MKRSTLLTTAGIVATATLVLAAAIGIGSGDGSPTPEASDPGPKTVAVTRGTLTDARTVDGIVGFGAEEPLAAKATGTVTWLPDVGATLARGDAVARIDDRPVVLLFGPIPAYRALVTDTEGADVRQFEENLAALGYGGFTVDTRYTDATATMVKRWQRSLGLEESGAVEPTQVVYAGGPQRVARRLVRIGAASGVDVIAVTSHTKVITVTMPADDPWATSGMAVTVVLSGGRSVPGTVSRLGPGPDTPTPGGGEGSGSGTPVEIVVADQRALSGVDGGRVDVRYVVEERADVLSVPVAALVALAEGGYGLEVVDASGRRFVAVTVGLFAEGRVEVSGPEVRAGVTVGIPS